MECDKLLLLWIVATTDVDHNALSIYRASSRQIMKNKHKTKRRNRKVTHNSLPPSGKSAPASLVHLIRGVGRPMAPQVRINSSPMSTLVSLLVFISTIFGFSENMKSRSCTILFQYINYL